MSAVSGAAAIDVTRASRCDRRARARARPPPAMWVHRRRHRGDDAMPDRMSGTRPISSLLRFPLNGRRVDLLTEAKLALALGPPSAAAPRRNLVCAGSLSVAGATPRSTHEQSERTKARSAARRPGWTAGRPRRTAGRRRTAEARPAEPAARAGRPAEAGTRRSALGHRTSLFVEYFPGLGRGFFYGGRAQRPRLNRHISPAWSPAAEATERRYSHPYMRPSSRIRSRRRNVVRSSRSRRC
jgi:hypothetical protein